MAVVPFKQTKTAISEVQDGLRKLSDLFMKDVAEIQSSISTDTVGEVLAGGVELWAPARDIYFEEGSYTERGAHMKFSHIDSFLDSFAGVDPQNIRVVTWKWVEGSGCCEEWVRPASRPDTYIDGVLTVQFINPGKARLFSAEAPVCRADREAVQAFLKPHAAEAARIWDGI